MKKLQLTQTRNTGQAKKVISKLLKKFPRWIQKMAHHSIEVIPQQREKLGEKIDGSYEHETERILLWDPDSNDELGLFIILSHEIGHKIYQEILETRAQQQWLKIFSQEYIEKSVQESYPSHKASEEQFCWLVSAALFFKIFNKGKLTAMIQKKEKELLKTNPQGLAFVKKIIRNDKVAAKQSKKPDADHIYHSQVIAFKKWLAS